VADPLSKSQVERLGKRLVEAETPSAADLDLLHELLLVRSQLLEDAIGRVRGDLRLAPTSRIKNTGTILDKLRRNGGSGLKSIQDLAGMRIVGTFDRSGQDAVVERVSTLFADEVRKPKVVDRRIDPMHGYAAVHVIVFPDGEPIEIQVRTARQHEWAELFEKLADLVGRGIRYGEPPRKWGSPDEIDGLPPELKELALATDKERAVSVELALAIAALIAALEQAEVVAPGAPEIEVYRRRTDTALSDFRDSVHAMEDQLREP
jgi:hypothetical protein